MQIQMTVNGAVVATVALDDNPSARDLLARLPLELVLKDYAGTEKISDLARPLSIQAAPSGYTPSAGDVSYYAPWGNLAIFHKDFRYSEGLVRLGRLESGLALMRKPGPITVRIDRATSP